MFRSDRMAFCEMYLQPETAFAAMSRLGDMGLAQFIDMNPETPAYLKNYIAEVCRMAKLERKLRYVEHEIIHDKIDIPDPVEQPEALKFYHTTAVENLIEKWNKDIVEISMNQSNLMQDLLELKEMRYVLKNIGPMLGSAELGLYKHKLKHAGDALSGHLHVMTGVVKRTRSFPFQLMLWRVSRGNIYYRQAKYDAVLEDPYSESEIRKVAFLAFCQGEMLATRMQKVFTGFKVNIYPCPETDEERTIALDKIEERIVDLEEVLHKAKYFRCRSLRLVSKEWKATMIRVRKAKACYHNLNLFTLDITKNCLIGRCWIPERHLSTVQKTLAIVTAETEANVVSFMTKIETDEEPPTTQNTNKFTYGFQMLINAYGESKYGEVNPGIFTVITFPFLFAIMFGDGGHAVIMIVFALWMLINEKEFLKQPGSEIWNIFFGGRYVILMLGLFSFYTGFVYNDVFSKAMNFGTSMWGNIYSKEYLSKNAVIDIDSKSRLNTPYVYGMDPVWLISTNKIMIDNSIKMKMSLIIGIIHMLFGIVVSIFNHIHYKKYYLIVFQFIPEFMFLFCIFFWLVFLIFYKWLFFYSGHENIRYSCSCAPQILILFIDMVLYSSTEKKPPDEGCEIFLFDSQQTLQAVLVTVALLMVPVLLFGTPFYVTHINKKKRKQIEAELTNFRKYQGQVVDENLQKQLQKYNAPFGELMIHQAVHTIEFVLSTISHTASYLRLWALSLAHAQLSEMLWVMVLAKLSISDHTPMGAIKIFIIFPIWALFTVAILVVMEGLSAFLHTLRLHWVEFMSKCFIGGGYPFKPFYFRDILAVEIKHEGACTAKRRKREKLTIETVNISAV